MPTPANSQHTMHAPSHTPGPWIITDRDADSLKITSPDYGRIAMLHDPINGVSELEANARLIAAAPELLSALQDLLEAYAPLAEDTVKKFGPDALHSAVKSARLALAKVNA